jgi:putative ABC transport system substrate-binding protein
MNRREIIAGLLFAATIGRAHAQQKVTIYRLAVVHPSVPVSDISETGNLRYVAFFRRLRELGYVEGRNLAVERYSGEGRTEHFAELAHEVVRGNPDLILAAVDPLAREVKAATDSIPVVALVADPVAEGIVPSLARPGGNITGVMIDADVVGTFGRRLELLREMVPTATRVGYLGSHSLWEPPYGEGFQKTAQRLNIALLGPPLDAPFVEAEYRRVFAAMAQDGADALMVSAIPANIDNRQLIVELAEKYRLPASYWYRTFADIGGLMVYGVDLPDIYRQAADQVDMIFKGTKPAEIPFFQPTKFELIINMKTAKALGITVPPTLLIAAGEVIE